MNIMKYIVIDNHDKDNKLNFENFTKMVDYFEPNEEDFPEFHDKWTQISDTFDLHDLLRNMENDERFEIVEIPEDVDILMLDGCTKAESEKHLKNGTTIFKDFEENFDMYMDEWKASCIDDEEYLEMVAKYKNMIATGEPVTDWGIVKYGSKTYYIMYCL